MPIACTDFRHNTFRNSSSARFQTKELGSDATAGVGVSLGRMVDLVPWRSRAAKAAASAVGCGEALVGQSAGRRADEVGDEGCGGAAAQEAVLQAGQADDDAAGGVGLPDVGDQRLDRAADAAGAVVAGG